MDCPHAYLSTYHCLDKMSFSSNAAPLTESLETCIRARHSVREFKPDAVDEQTLRECLRLAQLAPSNSNIQNWRLSLASGPARERIVQALKAAASQGAPHIPALPEKYKHFRSDFGHLLYGEEGYGIPRGDKERATAARMRNFEFFGAPVVGIITMDEVLPAVDAMCVGLFVQTFMLALTEKGLGSCLQVSVAGYPEVLRKEFGIPDDQQIFCGIAIGWPGVHQVNHLRTTREPLENQVKFLTE